MPNVDVLTRTLSELQAAVVAYGPCPEDNCCGNAGCVAMRTALKRSEELLLGIYAVGTERLAQRRTAMPTNSQSAANAARQP
jgi:hypothetical protein